MNTQIEKNEWKNYLTEFTSRNKNRPARLTILGDEIGASEEAEHLPLVMASYEEKGSDAGDALITLGGTNADDTNRIMHTVKQVSSVVAQIGDDANDAALEITGDVGEKAILIFEQPLEIEADSSAE